MDPWRKMFMIQKLGPKRPTVVKELCSPELTFLTSRFFVKSNSYFNNQSPYKLLWLTLYFPRIILEVEHGRFGSTFLRSLGETLLPGWQMFHRRLFPIERWLVTRERCVHVSSHARVIGACCSREFLEFQPWAFVHGVQLLCFLSFNNLVKTKDGPWASRIV